MLTFYSSPVQQSHIVLPVCVWQENGVTEAVDPWARLWLRNVAVCRFAFPTGSSKRAVSVPLLAAWSKQAACPFSKSDYLETQGRKRKSKATFCRHTSCRTDQNKYRIPRWVEFSLQSWPNPGWAQEVSRFSFECAENVTLQSQRTKSHTLWYTVDPFERHSGLAVLFVSTSHRQDPLLSARLCFLQVLPIQLPAQALTMTIAGIWMKIKSGNKSSSFCPREDTTAPGSSSTPCLLRSIFTYCWIHFRISEQLCF